MGSKKFRASRYPVVIRIIERTVIATCPDFNFPLPVTIYLGTDDLSDPAVIQKIGRAVRLAYAQIEALLSDLNDLNEEHPRPRDPKDAVPCSPKTVSIKEACLLSGLKPDALRALADQRIIKTTRTAGGHRRFERRSLEAYANGAGGEGD